MKKVILLLSLLCSAAYAAETIKLILPQPPGGYADTTYRKIQQKINENGQYNIVIINKPGGDGLVALNDFLNDKSDNTLMFVGPTLIIKSATDIKTTNTVSKLTPIVVTTTDSGTLFVSNKKSNIKTWNDLIRESKTRPINIGASSTIQKLILEEMFKDNSNVTVIPFTGDGPTLLSLFSNSIEVANLTITGSKKFITSGDLNGLMLTYGTSFNNIPTAKDLNVAIPRYPIFTGVLAHDNISKEKALEYNLMFTKALSDPEIKSFLTDNHSILPRNTSGESLSVIINDLFKKLSK